MSASLDLIASQCRQFELRGFGKDVASAIYFLVDGEEIVYVGQTQGIAHRLLMHLTEGKKTFDRVIWFGVNADDLAAHEGAFIRRLNPRYNITAPKDERRDAEILARFDMKPDGAIREAFELRRYLAWNESPLREDAAKTSAESRVALYRERKQYLPIRKRVLDPHGKALRARAAQRARAQRLFAGIEAAYRAVQR